MPEQRQRHDADAISPAMGARSRAHDKRVKQLVADAVAEPAQVPHVAIGDGAGQLGLDRQDAAVGTLDDEVDLLASGRSAQMKHPRAYSRCRDSDAKRGERLEQRTHERALMRERGRHRLVV